MQSFLYSSVWGATCPCGVFIALDFDALEGTARPREGGVYDFLGHAQCAGTRLHGFEDPCQQTTFVVGIRRFPQASGETTRGDLLFVCLYLFSSRWLIVTWTGGLHAQVTSVGIVLSWCSGIRHIVVEFTYCMRDACSCVAYGHA